jgi:formimidoylglutamate deiminase
LSRYFASSALLPRGWARDVLIEVDAAGDIASVTPGSAPGEASRLGGSILPGMPNVHSHAFQRALAGRAERGSPDGRDSFWSWRETMYELTARVNPDQLEAIAAWLYVEMLKAGYTAVGEFHYLHHDRSGARFARSTETSDRIRAAAAETGIGLTLLPVLYTYAGFGERPPSAHQRRFTMDAGEFVALWDDLKTSIGDDPQARLGAAPHSLRAVAPADLGTVVEHVTSRDPQAPLHIHIAEQLREVEECIAWSGSRPIEWLYEHVNVDARWCLVHATHANDEELARIAGSGAVAGICPTTEANLGDGIFPTTAFLLEGGRMGIGSDSHATVDVAEELRWLEYAQRLVTGRRAVLCSSDVPSVGHYVYAAAANGGAQALGRRIGAIAPGHRADVIVLDVEAPPLLATPDASILDRFIFGGAAGAIKDVMVGGRWVVRDRKHSAEDEIARRYRVAIDALFG